MGTRKGYWGKMPVRFSPQALRKEEVEEAVVYATRAFPDVLDLVPDFSSLALGEDAQRKKTAVLRFGDDGRTSIVRPDAVERNLRGLLHKIALHVRRRDRVTQHESPPDETRPNPGAL
jgi:hypothetical protein